MGQVRIFRVRAKGELQYPHSRKSQPLAQRIDARGDLPEVFGNERHVAKRLMDRRKERSARARHPAASKRSIGMPWHLPIGVEAAEMVEPDAGFQGERAADTL